MGTRNTLGDMHNILMEQLERLVQCDDDHLESEIERSKAVATVGQTVIANSKTILDAARLQATTMAQVPRILVAGATDAAR